MNLGPAELMIVLVIALVLFGGKKLPGLARSLGEAQREFRRGTEEGAAAPNEPERAERTMTAEDTRADPPATPG